MLLPFFLFTFTNTLHFTGGLLGVRAAVTLFTHKSRAKIQLQGIPIGGLIEGGASFDKSANVFLDDQLTKRLARLRVRVLDVKPSYSWQHVFVTVRLPIFLGTHTITLSRDPRDLE